MLLGKKFYYIIYFALFLFLYFISLHDIRLFHLIAEFYTIAIGAFVFITIYFFQDKKADISLNIIAVAYLTTSILDFLHILFYNDLLSNINDFSVAFWIVSRLIEALSLIAAAIYGKKHIDIKRLVLIYGLFLILIVFTILSGYFPEVYNIDLGLSKFKVYAEYTIIVLLLFALILFMRIGSIQSSAFKNIYIHIMLMIVGEFLFTQYALHQDISTFLGHTIKMLAYYFLYKAIVVNIIKIPFGLLLLDLINNYKKLDQHDIHQKLILNSINSHIILVDSEGKILNINKDILTALKTSEDELLSMYIWNTPLIEEDNKKTFKKLFLDNLRKQTTWSIDIKINDNVDIIYLTWTFNYTLNTANNEILCLCNGKDVTELRKKSFYVDRASQILENLPIMLVITDENKEIEYINPEFEAVSGYNKDDLIGNDVSIFKSDNPMNITSELWKTLNNNLVWRGIFHNRRKNGEEYIVKSIIFGLYNENKKKYYVSIQEDVTKNIHIKKAFFEKSQILDTIFNSMPAMVWLKDTENGIIQINKQVAEFYNIPFYELITKDNFESHQNLDVVDFEDDKIVIHTAAPRFIEKSYKVSDNEIKWIKIHKIPVFDEEKKVKNILAFALDITAQKEHEKVILANEASAIKDRDEKSRFLSNVSHELKTPMNTILAYSNMIYTDKAIESKKHNTMLRSVLSSGYYLMNIIDELLDVTRIESGKLALNNSSFDLKEFMQGIYNMFKIQILNDNITFFLEGVPEHSYYINCDSQKLYNILSNLISNAIKFTSSGGVKISLFTRENVISFVVEDTGTGMNEEQINEIYNPYYQADKGKEKGGIGLGLSIVHEYVGLLNGNIYVESEINKGTKFTVDIPIKKVDNSDDYKKEFSVLIVDEITNSLHDVKKKLNNLDVKVNSIQYDADFVEKAIEYINNHECIVFINNLMNIETIKQDVEKLLLSNKKLKIYIFGDSSMFFDEFVDSVECRPFNIDVGNLFDIICDSDDSYMTKINNTVNKPMLIYELEMNQYVINEELINKIIALAQNGDKIAIEHSLNELKNKELKNYLMQMLYDFQFDKIIAYLISIKGNK